MTTSLKAALPGFVPMRLTIEASEIGLQREEGGANSQVDVFELPEEYDRAIPIGTLCIVKYTGCTRSSSNSGGGGVFKTDHINLNVAVQGGLARRAVQGKFMSNDVIPTGSTTDYSKQTMRLTFVSERVSMNPIIVRASKLDSNETFDFFWINWEEGVNGTSSCGLHFIPPYFP